MASDEQPSAISTKEMANREEVCRLIAQGKRVIDPALRQRIFERFEPVRREMLKKHGLTDIAVDLIREVRDEE
jgi:hypothetical protein